MNDLPGRPLPAAASHLPNVAATHQTRLECRWLGVMGRRGGGNVAVTFRA
jgi:hypothetical protein